MIINRGKAKESAHLLNKARMLASDTLTHGHEVAKAESAFYSGKYKTCNEICKKVLEDKPC